VAAFVITDMRLLASVCPRVYRQRTALNETLVAVLDGTVIRPLIGMYPVVSAKIGFTVERLKEESDKPLVSANGFIIAAGIIDFQQNGNKQGREKGPRNREAHLSTVLPGTIEITSNTWGHGCCDGAI
jgi:hypothetical protein